MRVSVFLSCDHVRRLADTERLDVANEDNHQPSSGWIQPIKFCCITPSHVRPRPKQAFQKQFFVQPRKREIANTQVQQEKFPIFGYERAPNIWKVSTLVSFERWSSISRDEDSLCSSFLPQILEKFRYWMTMASPGPALGVNPNLVCCFFCVSSVVAKILIVTPLLLERKLSLVVVPGHTPEAKIKAAH